MSLLKRLPQPARTPVVLVVDDDHRVLELLDIAFQSHGFKVVRAGDGDEAIHRIASDRPDLLVMDVRLPKKSGLEVCEIIRRDPTDGHLPVILVSAASETEARLRAFSCGADDFVAKPFSPKELIARMRRLLARTADTRELRKQASEFEMELKHVRSDVQRAHQEARRELRLRESVFGPGRDVQRSLDIDDVCRTLLVTLQVRTGLGAVALLLPEPGATWLVPRAIRGDGFERLNGIRLAREGGVAGVVSGLGRLVKRSELDALRDLRDEVGPLIANGFSLLAPLRGPDGLVGLLLAEEPHDGHALEPAAAEEIAVLCDLAALAATNALRSAAQSEALVRALGRAAVPGGATQTSLYDRPRGAARETWREEAREIVMRAATATWLPPRQRELLTLLLGLGLPQANLDVLAEIERHTPLDPTGRLADMLEIERLAIRPGETAGERPAVARAALLLFVARRYAMARVTGVAGGEALTAAGLEAGDALDPATAQALNGALSEVV